MFEEKSSRGWGSNIDGCGSVLGNGGKVKEVSDAGRGLTEKTKTFWKYVVARLIHIMPL